MCVCVSHIYNVGIVLTRHQSDERLLVGLTNETSNLHLRHRFIDRTSSDIIGSQTTEQADFLHLQTQVLARIEPWYWNLLP